MRKMLRLTSMIVAVFILHLYTVPCFAAGKLPVQGEAKVTTNDPQFIPLTEEQEIKKGTKWYWYLIGLAVVGGCDRSGGRRRWRWKHDNDHGSPDRDRDRDVVRRSEVFLK